MTALIIIAVAVLAALWGFDHFERRRYIATLSKAEREWLAAFETTYDWRRFRLFDDKRGSAQDGSNPSRPTMSCTPKARVLLALMALTLLLGAIVVAEAVVVALMQISVWLMWEP